MTARVARRASAILAILAILASAWVGAAGAHQMHTSYTTMALGPGASRLELSIDESDLYLLFPQLDRNGDGKLWADEVLAGAEGAQAWALGRIAVRVDGDRMALQAEHAKVGADRNGNLFLHLPYAWTMPDTPEQLDLDLGDLLQPPLLPEHKNLLKLVVPGQAEVLSVLSAGAATHRIQLHAPEPESLLSQMGRFVWLGVEHIFLGYDHIMFLLALIVVGSRLGELVRIVSAFTVAHSITLVLATLEWVSLPPQLVESGIALSIAYVAAENFWLKRTDYRWVLTFGFGFVHGFGFASVLRDLGLPPRGLVASLLAFNVGVELGQVAIVGVVFPLVLSLARTPHHRFVARIASAVILLFGVGWLVERIFGLSYMPL